MKIPIVFAFDDNYALPASVAIMSLQATKAPTTEYEVIVLHDGLRDETMRKFERICPIRWIQVAGGGSAVDFGSLPTCWSGTTCWYRLLIADLLPEYDHVIWSDGDVLFKGDLQDVFCQGLNGYDWLGCCFESANEKLGIHNHFPERIGAAVFGAGFMIINARKWREDDFLGRCKSVIKKFGSRLTFCDLDVLNLAAESIGNVSFAYCVLSNLIEERRIENAPEYSWLERAQGRDALVDAVNHPIIVHYAGCGSRLKPWERGPKTIPADYWKFLVTSPFYEKRYFSPLCPVVLLWIFDALRFALAADPTRRKVLKTRTVHWENMVKNGKSAWLSPVLRMLRRMRLSLRGR